MRKPALTMLAVLLAAGGAWAGETPSLVLSAEWPEQAIEKNVIHRTRPPRGGWFDVVARIDAAGVELYRWQRARVSISAQPEIKPAKLLVDGAEQAKPDTTFTFRKLEGKKEVRWRFELPWTVRKAEPEYTFAVMVELPNRWADLRKSITIEQGISCYDTTFLARLKQVSQSRHCKLEAIGKSSAGREMHFLRVTDFGAAAAAKKKKFVMLGAYHGNEPSGHASILDFVHELTTRPENARYLKTCVLYIVPCMNPDGRALGWHQHPTRLDMNFVYDKGKELPEGEHVRNVLRKYKGEFTGALGMTTHQWGRPYLLLSHDPRRKGGWSDVLMRNVGVRVSNELAEYVHVQSRPPRDKKYSSSRGFMFVELGIPSFVLENVGGGRFNIGRQMPSIVRELHIYYAVLDQMVKPQAVTPKAHAPVKTAFPPEKNYQVFKVATPPKIDGKLDEACWKRPSVITGFVTSGRRPTPQGRTTVRVVYDDRNLYVAYACGDLKASDILPGEPGNIWQQDGADFMLDTNLNRWSYFQFQANANGAFSSAYWPIPGIRDADTFDPKGVKVAGAVKAGVIEISIPFAAFNGHPEMMDAPVPGPPKPGTVWGGNFCRNLPSTSWAPLTRNSHAPWEFNAMTFTGKTR